MIKELNIFIENKPGRLTVVTELLSKNNINIRAFTVQDRNDFGLMKLIVDRPDDANIILQENGFACAIKKIFAIMTDDKPGGLYKILKVFASINCNIKDSYGFVIDSGKSAVLCIEVEEAVKVKPILLKEGLTLLEEPDIYGI